MPATSDESQYCPNFLRYAALRAESFGSRCPIRNRLPSLSSLRLASVANGSEEEAIFDGWRVMPTSVRTRVDPPHVLEESSIPGINYSIRVGNKT